MLPEQWKFGPISCRSSGDGRRGGSRLHQKNGLDWHDYAQTGRDGMIIYDEREEEGCLLVRHSWKMESNSCILIVSKPNVQRKQKKNFFNSLQRMRSRTFHSAIITLNKLNTRIADRNNVESFRVIFIVLLCTISEKSL